MKKTLIAFAALFLTITAVVILGNVITIGEKMTKVFGTPYLEYGFYLLLFVVLMWLVAYPMYRIHHAPEFPVLRIEEQGEGDTDQAYQKRLYAFARRLSTNCYYLPEHYRPVHQQELQRQLADIRSRQDFEALKELLQKEIDVRVKCIDRRIMNYSSKVFIVTAISQSDRFDALTTLVLNYRMIDDIIRASGFRPTRPQLVKQYCRILAAAFLSYFVSSSLDSDGVTIALGDAASDSLGDTAAGEGLVDGLDSVDFDVADIDLAAFDLADIDLSNVDYTKLLKSIKIPGFAIDSILDGIANTIMTLRIGYVTKAYLRQGPKELKGKRGALVRKEAMKQALMNFPKLLRDAPERLGKGAWTKVLTLLQKVYKDKEKNESANDIDQTDEPRHRSLWRLFRR